MSYSLSAAGATPDDVASELRAKYAEMVLQQPDHAVEQEAVLACVNKLCGVVEPGNPKGYTGSMSGSLVWQSGPDATQSKQYLGASVLINVMRVY